MALTIAEANGWNHLARWLTGQSDREDLAQEAGIRFSAGASKKLLAGLTEEDFLREVWPRLLEIRSVAVADSSE